MSSNSLKVGMSFEDITSRTYTMSGLTEEELSPAVIKLKIQAVNKALGGDSSVPEEAITYAQNMQKTFISNGGASMLRIVSAKTISEEEEVIYSG